MCVALLSLLVGLASCQLSIVSSLIVTRHGARAPYLFAPQVGSKIGNWSCSFSLFEYPGIAPVSSFQSFDGQLYRKNYVPGRGALTGNCSQGQLTNRGAEMLRSTGVWLRQMLGSSVPLDWDDATMYARSTDIDRTFESAENLLQALFPSSSGSSSNASVINIWTIEKGLDDLDVAQNRPCPALVRKCTEISNSPEWIARYNANIPLLQKLANVFNVSFDSVPDIALVFDVLRAVKAQGIQIAGIDDAMYDAVEKSSSWELLALYSNDTVHKLTSSQLVNNILTTLVGASQGSGRVFTLLSAHDTTVAPLLSALQIEWSVWPQYAANVFFQLLKDSSGNYFVQVYHDRELVQMNGCSSSTCPLAEFSAVASASILPDRQAACQVSRRERFAVNPEIGYLCGS